MTSPDPRSGADPLGAPPPDPTGDPAAESGGGHPLSNVGDLVADISQDMSTLMRQEIALAKAEARQSASQAGKGAGLLGGASLAAYLMILFVSIAAWWGLGNLIGHGWSALVVALVWGVVAAVLGSMGRTKLKQVRGMPTTTETTKHIPDALKGNEDPR